MNKNLLLSIFTVVLLAGCAAKTVAPQSTHVLVTPNKAPSNCRFIGMIQGDQGNWFTGPWTPNKNLEQGAMNDLRNKAAALGANYVELVTNRASGTGSAFEGSGSMQQTGVITMGNAYSCPAL